MENNERIIWRKIRCFVAARQYIQTVILIQTQAIAEVHNL